MSGTSQNGTVEGWVWGPSRRGTEEVLWTSILTIVLCSWNTLYLNIPPRHWNKRRRFYQKLLFFGLYILSPEFVLQMAFGQWASARRSVKAFKAIKHTDRGDKPFSPWTVRHAFLADMGCFRLDTEDCRDYPLDAAQVHYLVARGYVDYSQVGLPEIEIDDRDKGGGILLLITVIEIIWFALSLNARAWFGNSMTPLELTAIGFVLPTLASLWLWRHKPLDTRIMVTLSPSVTVAEMRYNHEREAKDLGIAIQEHQSMPLQFIGREPQPHPWLGRIFPTRSRRIKIPDNNLPTMPIWAVLICVAFEGLFVGIHVWGWNFFFPTDLERDLWRYASLIMGGCVVGFWLNHLYMRCCHEPILQAARKVFGRSKTSRPTIEVVDPEIAIGRTPTTRSFERRGAVIVGMDKELSKLARRTSPAYLIPIVALAICYFVARGFIIAECFASLRELPANAYKNIMLSDVLHTMGFKQQLPSGM